MPDPPITKDDLKLLKCGYKIEEALVEEIYIKLEIIRNDIMEERESKRSREKALGRPK